MERLQAGDELVRTYVAVPPPAHIIFRRNESKRLVCKVSLKTRTILNLSCFFSVASVMANWVLTVLTVVLRLKTVVLRLSFQEIR